MNFNKVVVAGGGILGSQIAFQSAYCGKDVTILIREEDSVEELNKKLDTLKNILYHFNYGRFIIDFGFRRLCFVYYLQFNEGVYYKRMFG